MVRTKTNQLRGVNFVQDGKAYLVRCYACATGPDGRENYGLAVASGCCAWCGDTSLRDMVDGIGVV